MLQHRTRVPGGRTLVPFQGRFEKCAGPLVGYLAIKTVGYWADIFVTIDDGSATAAACVAARIAPAVPNRSARASSSAASSAASRWRP